MAIKEFLKGTFRLAAAIFLALVGLAAAVAIFLYAKESRELEAAKPFEAVKSWQVDLDDPLGVGIQARTKLVAGRLFVSVEVTGHPKYFVDPRNREGTLHFEFLDKDDFKVTTHPVMISDFTTIVGEQGEPIGLQHQYEEDFDVERYRQLSRMQVGWNLVTEPQPAVEAQTAKPILDHCAPGLSRAERLKRLAQHGQIRETGRGSFAAGGRSVTFFEYDGTILNCQ